MHAYWRLVRLSILKFKVLPLALMLAHPGDAGAVAVGG
jgi:hypothetical protein